MIVSIPELLATIFSPTGQSFTGALVNPDDLNTYLTAIRQGADGHWLFTPPYSPEPVPAHLAYIPYLIIGHILGSFGSQSYYFGYLTLRILSLGISFYAFDQLIKSIFPSDQNLRKKIFRVLLFSGGAGWLLVAFLGPNTSFTPDLTTPEWNLVLNFFSAPHFLLGIGFETLLMRELILLANESNRVAAIKIALWGTGLGLTYPFLVPVIGVTIAMKLAYITIITRKIPTGQLLKALIGSLPMVALLIYFGIILPKNQWYQQTMLQNNTISPPNPFGLLLGFSFFIVPAILGMTNWLKSKRPIVIPFWVLANIIVLYLPFSFSGRFLAGMFIPLSILAVYGVLHIGKPSATKASQDRRFNLYFLFLLPGNLIILLFLLQSPRNTLSFPYYIPDTEIQALHWLGENTTSSDLVLSEYPIGSIAPRYLPAKVFIGHLNLTIDLPNKRNQVLTFWDDETSTEERMNLIDQWGITYVYQGVFENNISEKEVTPPGDLVYENEDVFIYAVSPSP